MKTKTKKMLIDMSKVSGVKIHRRKDGKWEMVIETKGQRKHYYGLNETVEEWTGRSCFTCEAVENFNIFVKEHTYED